MALIGEYTAQGQLNEYKIRTGSTTNLTPHLIAVDNQGNVWWSEGFAGAIGKLNISRAQPGTNDGVTEYVYHGLCATCGTHTSGLVVDHRGVVWFTDSLQSIYGAFNGAFTLYNTPTPNSHPHDGLNVDGNNVIWFNEEFANKLARHSYQTLLSGAAASGPIQVNLTHRPKGSVSLLWNPADHTLRVKVSLSGLAPNSTHPEHIHAGSCASATMGSMVYELRPVVADEHGVGSATTIITDVMQGIPAHGWYVMVHNGPLMMTALQSRAIACANIINAQTSLQSKQQVHVPMTGTMDPDESVHGHAWISIQNGNLIVKVSLSGLVPNSMHMDHIHAGSCKAQGPEVYPLQMLVADANGNATATTSIKHPSEQNLDMKLYINIHEAGTMSDMNIQEGFNPIACGNIVD